MVRSIRIVFVLAILASSGIVYGQPYVGAFGGLNLSKLNGDQPKYSSYKNLIGVNAGIHLDIKVGKIVWLSLQPSYSQEGTRIAYNYSDKEEPIDSIHIRLNYFSLPLLLKVQSNNKRWYAVGGLEAGYLLDKKLSSHDVEYEFENNIEEWNLMAHFGVGHKIPLGFPVLYVELRYVQGLINLTEDPIEKSYIPRVKTKSFKFLVGIEFPLKRTSN
jgi:hypothetical protein